MESQNVLAVDPGLRACGVAEFRAGLLRRAAYVESSGESCGEMASAVRAWYGLGGSDGAGAERAIVELPRVYGRGGKGDSNDLVNLATVCGALCVALTELSPSFVYPGQWKGEVPKEVMMRRIIGRLSPEELAAVALPRARGLQHNVFDAVGIGLWAIGRIGR